MRVASLGNGNLLVNVDEKGRIVDLYYPYVGMENQTSGEPIRYAAFSDGVTSVDDEWKVEVGYLDSTNMVEVRQSSDRLNVSMLTYYFLDNEENTLYSLIKVFNNSPKRRDIKLFFINNFNLYASSFGDTGFYDPITQSVIHYKAKRYIGVKLFSTSSFTEEYQISKGDLMYDVYDGKLDGGTIANGDVNSAVAVNLTIDSNTFSKAYFTISFSRELEDLRRMLRKVNFAQVETSFTLSYMFWKNWLSRSSFKFTEDKFRKLYNVSLLAVRNHMDGRGSLIASSDYSFVKVYADSYQYCWPRDCAYASYALEVAGYRELVNRHLHFMECLTSNEGFFYHKYNPDGSLASSWHPWVMEGRPIYPIQEDETALPIWLMGAHFEAVGDVDEIEKPYKRFVKRSMRFLMDYMEEGLPKPSFDLWEERYGIHMFTVATVYGALQKGALLAKAMGDEVLAEDSIEVATSLKEVAMKRLVSNGRFIRRIDEHGEKDMVVDASMYAPYFFGMVKPDDPIMVKTIQEIEGKLKVNGGIIRYENDFYQRRKKDPNPWVITTLWVAEYYADLGKVEKAMEYINWVSSKAIPSGLLPEQVDPETGEPTSVTPLVWSHAEYIIAINKAMKI
ncbi:glycoside hydrolase family 15 protein [Sulfuracidifex tepidarius]|uniref:GH15-like domain-containing protein n=1 Tax=Sulfuracidifex tepidarius TaxID=1294262 RepID=A0A510E325_9CREN|nr:glycoside hydrolase family 15 protein [Sulfuracidifex tepidarius]BBG24147.1 hypothetical protein IC006_1450 [Sulfuracidifex tepidarius]BBG26904.1 hypothetical protein IC007_1427 [Sulfuracidifex tepidarius]